jgi:cation transport ATPase
MKTLEFDVTGMGCSACQKRVQNAAAKVAGVKTAIVDLVTRRLTVTTVDDSPALAASVIAAVIKAGYGAKLIGK